MSFSAFLTHHAECVIGVFLHVVESLHSGSKTITRDALILMTEAVTVLTVIAIASLVCEILLAT